MSKWLYGDHLGGFFLTDKEIPDDMLYCEECGDWDWPYGKVDSFKDAWNAIFDMIALKNEDGGYIPEAIFPLLLDAATPEEKAIVKEVCGDLQCDEDGYCHVSRQKILKAVNKIGGKTRREEEDE